MKNHLRKLALISLIILLVLSLTACKVTLSTPGSSGGGTSDGGATDDPDGGGTTDTPGGDGEVTFPDDGGESTPGEGWEGEVVEGYTSVRAFIGEQLDLTEYLPDGFGEDRLWEVNTETIATVEDGVISPQKCGRTTVKATDGLGEIMNFLLTVEFKINPNVGFNIVTDVSDKTPKRVESEYEANRLLDLAVMEHKHSIVIDFSGISEDYRIDDFELDIELGVHAHFKTSYYESNPTEVTFEIVYNPDAASTVSTVSPENRSLTPVNGNAAVRDFYRKGTPRVEDFENFAINLRTETFPVYNSEELWWAVEHGYKPTFPIPNTKAELFYERAKMILREIVDDSMTDYEKILAIYEYLITAVNYDYDAFNKNLGKENSCYYLEGVFENGLAVCDGKTKAFLLLAGIEGIECLRDYGSSRTGGAGHAWNYVKLDGEWYLVDTTEGDSRQSLLQGSGIADFFGASVELTSYFSFLTPIDSHTDKYIYGEIWYSIFDDPDGVYESYPTVYFDRDQTENVDFILGSKAEAKALLSAVISLYGEGDFSLTLLLEGEESKIHSYLDAAEELGYDSAVFTTYYGETKVYITVFTPLLTEAEN